MPFCTNCGHDNPEGANFCAQCGAPLTAAPPHPAAAARVPTGDTTKTIPPVVDDPTGDGLSPVDEAAVQAVLDAEARVLRTFGSDAEVAALDAGEPQPGRYQAEAEGA